MSLKEFLEFRKECPICNNPNLSTYFTSKKNQEHLLDSDCYTIKMPLLDLSHQRQGDICYSFSLNDDTFWIDFCDKQGNEMRDHCPNSFLKRFIKLSSNMRIQYFYKLCDSCKRYNYISSSFVFDLKSGTTTAKFKEAIEIDTEYLGLFQKRENDYKLFRIINYFDKCKSSVEYGFDDKLDSLSTDSAIPNEPNFYTLEMPMISFTSEEKMIDRLSKLIVFS